MLIYHCSQIIFGYPPCILSVLVSRPLGTLLFFESAGVTMNFQMFRLDLEKAEETEIKLPTSVGSPEKQESSKKLIYFCFIDYAKALDSGSQQTMENS